MLTDLLAAQRSFKKVIDNDVHEFYTQLPLSEMDVQRSTADKANFQTKSLECIFSMYEITTEGHLEKMAASRVIGPDRRTLWQTIRMVDAYGFVAFYTEVNDEWFCFKARFREGRVTNIFRLWELPEIRSRTCTWELELPVDELQASLRHRIHSP